METVRFQCGQCRKLIAVTVRDLGKLVRCPHCRQAVQAPLTRQATTAPPPTPPSDPPAATPALEPTPPEPSLSLDADPIPEIRVPEAGEGDSIFSPPEASSDDLFGVAPPVRVELPPEPAPPQLAIARDIPPAPEPLAVAPPEAGDRPEPALIGEATISFITTPTPPPDFQAAAFPPPALVEPAPVLEQVVTDLPALEPAAGEPTPATSFQDAAPEPAPSPLAFEAGPQPEPVAATPLPAPSLPRRPQAGGSLGVFLLVLLVPYAVISTGALVWLIYQQRTRPPATFDPLERLPDPDPKQGGPKRVKFDAQLPDKLKTALGQPIRVGDIEVTPLKVDRVDEGGKQVLTLQLKFHNVSKDTAFDPLPPAFVYYRPRSRFDLKPYTFLQVGAENAYGGNLEWVKPLPRKGFDGVLYPRQQGTLLLQTHPRYSRVVELLDHHKGSILWRVQVRRGFVDVNGKDVSATAIIGVRIDPSAIPQLPPQDARLSLPFALPTATIGAILAKNLPRGRKVALPTFATLL